jgi:hypothetical protein
MSKWYSSIYKACILASLISFIIGFFSKPKISLGAYLAGYSVLILGIMMIIIILFNNILKINGNSSNIQIFYTILMTSGPFILMLGVIAFILYLLITYYNRISEGEVASGYNTFSNIIVMLLLLQLYLVYNNIDNTNFETSGKISKVVSSIIYLLGVLTTICSINLYIILKYYTTDGFKLINFDKFIS